MRIRTGVPISSHDFMCWATVNQTRCPILIQTPTLIRRPIPIHRQILSQRLEIIPQHLALMRKKVTNMWGQRLCLMMVLALLQEMLPLPMEEKRRAPMTISRYG